MGKHKKKESDFPGYLVVKIPCFQLRECKFNPWSGDYDPHVIRCAKQKVKMNGKKENGAKTS